MKNKKTKLLQPLLFGEGLNQRKSTTFLEFTILEYQKSIINTLKEGSLY
jgi:hypothetical protein